MPGLVQCANCLLLALGLTSHIILLHYKQTTPTLVGLNPGQSDLMHLSGRAKSQTLQQGAPRSWGHQNAQWLFKKTSDTMPLLHDNAPKVLCCINCPIATPLAASC